MGEELQRFAMGERPGMYEAGRLHRYALYCDHVSDKRVLEIFTGDGAGAALLAETAREVIAIDSDAAAIREARSRYGADNLRYSVADGRDLPFQNGSFDVVVLDGIEMRDAEPLIVQARRLLNEQGLLLISTNDEGPGGVLTPAIAASFKKMLEGQFPNVQLSATRMAQVSVSFDLAGRSGKLNQAAAKIFVGALASDGAPAVVNGEIHLPAPTSLVATCSSGVVDVSPFPSSVLVPDQGAMEAAATGPVSGVADEQVARLSAENAILRKDATQSLSTLARLLSRLTGGDVASDPMAMIEAMFSLNERIVTQKAQMVRLAAEAVRLDDVDRLLGEARADALHKEAALAEAMAGLEEARARFEEEEGQVALLQSRLAEQDAALATAQAAMAELRAHQATWEQKAQALATAETELAGYRAQQVSLQLKVSALEAEVAEVKAARERLERAVPSSSVPAGDMAGAPATRTDPRVSEGRRRFAQAHRKVLDHLDGAHGLVVGKLAPAASPPTRPGSPKSWHRRVFPKRRATAPGTALFDAGWIAAHHADRADITWKTYLDDAALHRIDPHPLFDAGFYLDRNPDVAQAGINPLWHYLEHGWREGRDPHPFFANDWYLAQNPDVLETGVNPLEHYLAFGWREGRWPNPVFDPRAYLDRYLDVDREGMEPLTHYIAHGRYEQREVPIRAIEHLAATLPAEARGWSMMDYLLHAEVASVGEEPARAEPPLAVMPAVRAPAPWPPERLDDYWLPQTLRDVIIDGHGEEVIDLYWYLCSVMHRYQERQKEFPGSPACGVILARVRALAAARAAGQTGGIDASIIVPVYNNILDTLLCITTVLETAGEQSFEIIIADDGSNDATAELIRAIGGAVRYVRQPHNLGFLGNCNAAAKQARGDKIVLLNNDTLVLPDWLDALLRPFDRFEKVGFTGSKLINWDGTLQEAGGIFWEDGSAWNFGRNQDARAPEFNYLKDVDYCSGASIAIPRSLWEELGGFDPRYTPAYCEDSDIAFRIREAGYRTLYQPFSEVVHHEGRSHGRDVTSGIKAYQVANNAKLLERWGPTLRADHYPNAQNVFRARDRSRYKKHVLLIDHYIPQWDQDAGSRTIYQYIQSFLDMGYCVTFWPDNLWRDPHYTPMLEEMGVEVIWGRRFHERFADFLRERADLYDAVFLSRPHVAINYLDAIRAHSSARILYYGHDLHYRRMQANLELNGEGSEEEIARTRELEWAVCRKCDVIFYPDPAEVAQIEQDIGGDRIFLNNPVFVYTEAQVARAEVDLSRITRNRDARLLFVGGFNHYPNREGIIWFVQEVLPIVRQRFPDVTLDIAGSKPPSEVLALAGAGVNVLGYVSDEHLEQLYAAAGLAVAPLRYGAGVKGKVIEAMASGVPMATTSIGAQGIDVGDRALFLGDSPAELARAITEGLQNRDEATRRTHAGLQFIKDHYSSKALKDMFAQLIN
ncbi:glycosyltransferase [Sphingobium sp. RSMS]|uniref:glycosyltransferase n=1 Tax=Sphingobium sp. RSMS TaxID=520734 RepID=UPI0010F6607A|nr:glycosyltransferase [Sphingobium sp. RSMS]UXC89783.1 glycosyltransferase [Sphingobium sp. RSMS]